MVFAGLVCLYFGGKWIVDGAVLAAKQFGLSEFLISATILAIGTSLPEVITGITAARKLKEKGLVSSDKDKVYSLTKKGERELKEECAIFCKTFYDVGEMISSCKCCK